MSFFIAEAVAEAAPVPAQQDPFFPLIMMVGMVVIFYFFMWRPQSKRAKEHKQLMSSMSKGDEVVMGGGILGRVMKVDDNYATLEIANNVQIKVQKSSVVSTLPKGTIKAI